jgi:DNA processing protein
MLAREDSLGSERVALASRVLTAYIEQQVGRHRTSRVASPAFVVSGSRNARTRHPAEMWNPASAGFGEAPMLPLPDAAALCVWPKCHLRGVVRFIRAHLDGPDPDTPPLTLATAVEAGGAAPADVFLDKLREEGTQALSRAKAAGITPVPLGDPRYPPLLALILDPPVVLWGRGDCSVLRQPAVALVGSRSPSPYGVEAATSLASSLARTGVTIVSGLARGIDSVSHRSALQEEGTTIAVLGSGPDVIYPPEHAALADSIARSGAVVAEVPPGTPPRAIHFPARNRIISGLSLAVVVVEAAEQSGSLITAEFAADQGRSVMAVPGSIFSVRHGGCHALIRDGAMVASSADEVAWELSTSPLRAFLEEPSKRPPARDALLERMVTGEAYDLDGLARESGLSPAILLSRLLELELQGAVRRADGSRFVRVSRTC